MFALRIESVDHTVPDSSTAPRFLDHDDVAVNHDEIHSWHLSQSAAEKIQSNQLSTSFLMSMSRTAHAFITPKNPTTMHPQKVNFFPYDNDGPALKKPKTDTTTSIAMVPSSPPSTPKNCNQHRFFHSHNNNIRNLFGYRSSPTSPNTDLQQRSPELDDPFDSDNDEPEPLIPGIAPTCCNCRCVLPMVNASDIYTCQDGRQRRFCVTCPSPKRLPKPFRRLSSCSAQRRRLFTNPRPAPLL